MTQTILHIDASARTDGSVSRQLSAAIAERFPGTVIRRDLAAGLPLIDEAWIGANFTPEKDRTSDQRALLALSDELIAEIKAADVLVLGVPMYNFSVPGAFKAWIDLVCRAGLTFKYTDTGPVGLLTGKRAVVALATGGVPAGSAMDFSTDYLRHILGFVGITDVEFVAADQVLANSTKAIEAANAQIARLAA